MTLFAAAALAAASSFAGAPFSPTPGPSVLPATPTAYPTFVVPSEPEEVPTVSVERIAGGGVAGLLAGFVAGGTAGILRYNYTRRKIPGLPTLSDGALTNGVRWGAYGAGVLGLGIAAYAAYSTPRKPPPDLYPFLLKGEMGTTGGVSRTAPPDPSDLALADAQVKVTAMNVAWIQGLELDGDKLVVKVSDTYDAVPLSRRKEVFPKVLAAWAAARRAHTLSPANELWIKGTTFLALWRPEQKD